MTLERMRPMAMTNKQKQCLLCYLGYYVGEIDGSWGSKTATLAFQRDYGLEDDGLFGSDTEKKILAVVAGGVPKVVSSGPADWWASIKHFKRSEFACHCGGEYCNGFPVEMQQKLIVVADRVRDHFKAPVQVSSGVRDSRHNANVGGVSNSRHLSGKAMDFAVRGKTSAQVLAYVQKQPEIRYAYAIDGSFVHMDIE